MSVTLRTLLSEENTTSRDAFLYICVHEDPLLSKVFAGLASSLSPIPSLSPNSFEDLVATHHYFLGCMQSKEWALHVSIRHHTPPLGLVDVSRSMMSMFWMLFPTQLFSFFTIVTTVFHTPTLPAPPLLKFCCRQLFHSNDVLCLVWK